MKKKHPGFVLWFTGLSGAGKSTLANAVYKKLKKDGYKVERLDGDTVRENLTKDLGFSKKDRENNIKRVAFVSSLLSKHGVGVVASFISPYKKERDYVRKVVTNFCEIYISTPLNVCEKRDTKGLYKKARKYYGIYGKLSEEKLNRFPTFGIVYELMNVNNDDLYETVSYIIKDFLENHNKEIYYNYIKIGKTDSIEKKKNLQHKKLIEIIPDCNVHIFSFSDSSITLFISLYPTLFFLKYSLI